ncbi:MAG: 17 kDa surface antigen [Rhodocyclaceae bacterium]|nr:17 kDa surface antigen [Rhodocyclaceae bacterium]
MVSLRAPMIVLLATAVLAGCATSRSGNVYTRDQARQEMSVRTGVVESIRGVTMEGTRSGVGTIAGGAVGGVAGSSIGGGKGQAIGAILGAVAGGVAGQAIEEGTTRKQAMEITVRLDSGQTIAVVQEGDPAEFRAGDRVRLLSSRGETRVSR